MSKETWFWNIIEQAAKDTEKLYPILSGLGKEEIIDFQTIFVNFSVELQDEPFTEYMEESEDGIEDIANWIVSCGKKYYEMILENPEKIPYSVEDKTNEILYGVADEVFFERFGKSTGIY